MMTIGDLNRNYGFLNGKIYWKFNEFKSFNEWGMKSHLFEIFLKSRVLKRLWEVSEVLGQGNSSLNKNQEIDLEKN